MDVPAVMFVIDRHIQVLVESPESIARREEKPKTRKKYLLSCTCRDRRRENGHCRHTLALAEDSIKPWRWRDITVTAMKGKEAKMGKPERSYLDLHREIVSLRKQISEAAA